MNSRNVLPMMMILGAAGVCTGLPASPARAAEEFAVDSVHSTVFFRVKHMGVSYAYGRFNELSGSFSIDPDDASKSSFNIEIKTESLDTKSSKRDGHLKSPDFFNVKQFPVITFKSEKVEKLGKDRYQVTGKLTLHGITRQIEAEVEHVGTSKGRRGLMSGFETTFTIKRSDYDMKFMLGEALGDEVRITLSIEGGQRGDGR